MSKPSCETCRFFDPNQHQLEHGKRITEGNCRKNPPVVKIFVDRDVVHGGVTTQTRWPLVHPQDWCGAFELVEDPGGIQDAYR